MKNLKNKQQLVSYIHGIICVMNRQKKTAITEAIKDLFNVDAARNWDLDRLFWFINDMMTLLEEERYHQEYWKLFSFIHSHICVYKDEIK